MIKEIAVRQPKICCVADLHIGIHQNSIFWHETTLKWAAWLKQDLEQKSIQDIFILGDLYHYRDEIAVNTIHVVNEILKLWSNFNIVIIVGNHDAFYKDRSDINSLSILNGWKNITIISTATDTKLFGKNCAFLPWGADVTDIQKADIIFGHLEIESFKMNSFKLCDHGMKTKDLLNKAPLILTGHFHLRDERKYDKGTIVYVGNPFEMDFGDTGSTKGYYILDLNDSSYEFHENKNSPKHKKVTLTDLTQLKSLSGNDAQEIFNSNIVKLIVDKKITSDNIDILLKKLSLHNPFSLSVDYSLYNDNITVNDDQDCDLSGVDINKAIEEFINILDIQNKKEVIEYCTELYKKCR